MACPLCDPRALKARYDDSICFVATCPVCQAPLVVWRRHGRRPTPAEEEHMIAKLRLYGSGETFQPATGQVDKHQREFSGHWHAHLRS